MDIWQILTTVTVFLLGVGLTAFIAVVRLRRDTVDRPAKQQSDRTDAIAASSALNEKLFSEVVALRTEVQSLTQQLKDTNTTQTGALQVLREQNAAQAIALGNVSILSGAQDDKLTALAGAISNNTTRLDNLNTNIIDRTNNQKVMLSLSALNSAQMAVVLANVRIELQKQRLDGVLASGISAALVLNEDQLNRMGVLQVSLDDGANEVSIELAERNARLAGLGLADAVPITDRIVALGASLKPVPKIAYTPTPLPAPDPAPSQPATDPTPPPQPKRGRAQPKEGDTA